MPWFKRVETGIHTPTEEKKETPDGLWYKCPSCKAVTSMAEHRKNLSTCVKCNHHDRIGSKEYFAILFDDNEFTELDADLTSGDLCGF